MCVILGNGAVGFGLHCLTNGAVGGIVLFLSCEGAQFLSSRLPVLR